MKKNLSAIGIAILIFGAFASAQAQINNGDKMKSITEESRLERGKRLLKVVDGEIGEQVIKSLADIAPDFADYLFEYPFGDVYARPGLNLRDREIATIAMLTAMGTTAPQLKVHVIAGLNVGLTEKEIVEIMIQSSVYAGFPSTLNGLAIAKDVFAGHRKNKG